MEPVKDRFTRLGRNARSLVVDADADLVAYARRSDLDQSAGGREAHSIVQDVVDRPRQPVGLAHYDGAVLARSGKGDARIARLAPRFPARGDLLDQRPEIDPVEPGAGQLGIGAGGFADVVDQ